MDGKPGAGHEPGVVDGQVGQVEDGVRRRLTGKGCRDGSFQPRSCPVEEDETTILPFGEKRIRPTVPLTPLRYPYVHGAVATVPKRASWDCVVVLGSVPASPP